MVVTNRQTVVNKSIGIGKEPLLMKGSEQLTSLSGSAAFETASISYVFTKQATSMRRPTVLSFPLQLVFRV